jgi:hypothetical protein
VWRLARAAYVSWEEDSKIVFSSVGNHPQSIIQNFLLFVFEFLNLLYELSGVNVNLIFNEG